MESGVGGVVSFGPLTGHNTHSENKHYLACGRRIFYPRDRILCCSAYMLSPVRLSVCLSDGWIIKKTVEVRIM